VLKRAGRPEEATAVLEEAHDRYSRKRNLAMVTRVRQQMSSGEDSVPVG
jgi:hypothetical protein